MKILLLAPQYWISGTVTFVREIQNGWPSELPLPVVAVPTRSGKPSALWGRAKHQLRRATHTTWLPDAYGSPQEMIELARDFDLVHVTEVDMPQSQREWWVQLLEQLPVPWTIQLHGNVYDEVDWSRICAARNFIGVVYRTPGNTPAALAASRKVRFIDLPRPWNRRNLYEAPAAQHETGISVIGTHGRIASNKGVALIAALSQHMKIPVCIHGASQAGGYPYALTLRSRYCFDCDAKQAAHLPWMSDDDMLRYEGPFSDGVVIASHHDVHVSATREGFSAGTEYAVLEAIDAGCRIVQPTHMAEESGFVQWLYDWENRGVVGALRDPLPALNDAVRAALDVPKYDPAYNRAIIARHHDPARIVRAFLSEVATRV